MLNTILDAIGFPPPPEYKAPAFGYCDDKNSPPAAASLADDVKDAAPTQIRAYIVLIAALATLVHSPFIFLACTCSSNRSCDL